MSCENCGAEKRTHRMEELERGTVGSDLRVKGVVRWECCAVCDQDELVTMDDLQEFEERTVEALLRSIKLTGKQFRWCRAVLGLKREDLSDLLNVDVGDVLQWEDTGPPAYVQFSLGYFHSVIEQLDCYVTDPTRLKLLKSLRNSTKNVLILRNPTVK